MIDSYLDSVIFQTFLTETGVSLGGKIIAFGTGNQKSVITLHIQSREISNLSQ